MTLLMDEHAMTMRDVISNDGDRLPRARYSMSRYSYENRH